MAVLKKDRKLSPLAFYHNAVKMRKEITMLTLRDFGIHSRGAKFKEDTGSQQPEGFYDELMAFTSKNIWILLRNMMWCIRRGNRYPSNMKQLEKREEYQTKAIQYCGLLAGELQDCIEIMPMKASSFMPYIEMINYEIALLKGWRKSNSKLKKAIDAKLKKASLEGKKNLN